MNNDEEQIFHVGYKRQHNDDFVGYSKKEPDMENKKTRDMDVRFSNNNNPSNLD